MADYPTGREPFFAHKLVRRMGRVCAAQDMGADACWLVTQIAHLEDTKRYTEPVKFWNEQLTDIVGFHSWGALDRARKRAIEAGWLHYEPGGKGKVGKYWTMIPDRYSSIPDGAYDAGEAVILSAGGDTNEIIPSASGEDNEGQTRDKRGTNGDHSSLPLFPDPDPEKKPSKPAAVSCNDIPIPDVLDTPPFRDVWGSWLAFRREHKYSVRPSAVKGQLTILQKMGSVEAAISSIESSIAGGYKGLFKQNESRSHGKPKPPSAAGHDPDNPVTPI